MEFMGTGMMTTLACGCCCLAVVIVVGVAAVLGMRRRGQAGSGGVGDTPEAPARGSSTNARLTYMEEPLPASAEAATVQLRPLPKSVPPAGQSVNRPPPVPDGTTPRPAPQPEAPRPAAGPTPPPAPPPGGPRVIAPNPTFIPPADDEPGSS